MSNVENTLTFGTSENKSLVTSIVVFGGGTENRKVQDLRAMQEPALQDAGLEGQVPAEEILIGLEIRSFGQKSIASHLSLASPYFSDGWLSTDIFNHVSIGFCFDKKEFMKRNAVFPEAANIRPDTLSLLGFFDPDSVDPAPTSMKVVRKKVHKDKRVNGRFGKGKYEVDESSKVVIAESSNPDEELRRPFHPGKIGLISFHHRIGESQNVDLYTTIDVRNRYRTILSRRVAQEQYQPYPDSGYDDFHGSYQYGVEITMRDRTPQIMQSIIFLAEKKIHDLKKIVQQIISGVGTSDNTQYLARNNTVDKPVGDIVIAGSENSLRGEQLANLVDFMMGLFTVFSQTPETDRINFERRLDFAANTRGLAPLENIIDFLEGYIIKVMDKLRKTMPTLEPLSIARGNAGATPGGKEVAFSTYEHYFDEIIDINPDALNGVEFIPSMAENLRSTAFHTITADQYKSRSVQEVEKYFNTFEDDEGNIKVYPGAGLPDHMGDRLNPIPNAYSFLSPQMISVGCRGAGTKHVSTYSDIRRANNAALMLAYLMKQKQDNVMTTGPQVKSIHRPYVTYRQQRPTPAQKITPVLEDILETSGCQVRYAAAGDVTRVTRSRLGADAFFGALLNDDPNIISKRQMLNDNLGLQPTLIPQARIAPPLVSRSLMTIAADQVNLTKDSGENNFFEQKSTSLAEVTYLGPALGVIRSRNNVGTAKATAVKEPGVNTPENPQLTVRDIPPALQSVLAIQYARKIAEAGRGRYERDKDAIQEAVKFEDFHSIRSDEYNLEAEDSSLLQGFDERSRSVNVFDPMKNKSKFANYWVNYKFISSVEYLSGFSDFNLKQPIWKRLRQRDVDSIQTGISDRVLCRLNIVGDNPCPFPTAEQDNLGTGKVDLFDVPIYNKYFFLGNDDATLLTPQMVAQRAAQQIFGNEGQNEEQNEGQNEEQQDGGQNLFPGGY